MGKCPQCGSFNSMVEEVIHDEPVTKSTAVRGLTGRSAPRAIGDISAGDEDRIRVPIEEFARVLGGGIVPGSIVLVGGDPGIGKSTLMLQMAMEMASSKRVLYVSGEESERQIKMRATRLNSNAGANGRSPLPANLLLVTETNLEIILNHINEVKPELLIVDSIQTHGLVRWLRESSARVFLAIARTRKDQRHLGLCDRACHQRRDHRRSARVGTYRGYGFVSRRRPLPSVSLIAFGKESFRRNL